MLSRIYRLLWLGLLLLFMLSQEILDWVLVVWNKGSQRLWSCWPERSVIADCANIAKYSQVLKKHPKHIAFLVTPEEADGSQIGILQKLKFIRTSIRKQQNIPSRSSKEHGIDIGALSRLVTWTWAANIPVISLYDCHGESRATAGDQGIFLIIQS